MCRLLLLAVVVLGVGGCASFDACDTNVRWVSQSSKSVLEVDKRVDVFNRNRRWVCERA